MYTYTYKKKQQQQQQQQQQLQKQPPRRVPRKRCSEDTHQIYRRKPIPKCDLTKVVFQDFGISFYVIGQKRPEKNTKTKETFVLIS